MSARDQALVDKLTVVIPRLQRVQVTLHQQAADLGAALLAAEEMTALLRKAPAPLHQGERHVTSLQAAILRSGKTFAEASFLAGIGEPRLQHLAAGAKPTDEERAALLRTLPDWKP